NRRAKAMLVDISRDGALLLTDEVPPAGVLWMRMESPARTDWVAAVPIRQGPSRRVAVRFPRPCEDDLLLAATLGLDFGPALLDGGLPRSCDDAPAAMPACPGGRYGRIANLVNGPGSPACGSRAHFRPAVRSDRLAPHRTARQRASCLTGSGRPAYRSEPTH